MNIKGIVFIYSMCTCKSFLIPISVEGQSHATAVAQCQGHSQAGKVYLCPWVMMTDALSRVGNCPLFSTQLSTKQTNFPRKGQLVLWNSRQTSCFIYNWWSWNIPFCFYMCIRLRDCLIRFRFSYLTRVKVIALLYNMPFSGCLKRQRHEIFPLWSSCKTKPNEPHDILSNLLSDSCRFLWCKILCSFTHR